METIEGAIAILEYGGRVRGTSNESSDVDLILVCEKQLAPNRFHSARVDLTLVSVTTIEALLTRLAVNEERPWDGLFESVRVVTSRSEQVTELIRQVQQTYSKSRLCTAADVSAARFACYRAIEKIDRSTDVLELRMAVAHAVGLLLHSSQMLNGKRWSGVRNALMEMRATSPTLYAYLEGGCTAQDALSIVASLRLAEESIFGQPWGHEVVSFGGGLVTAGEIEQIDSSRIERINDWIIDVARIGGC